jgi:hypothetical protein
MKRTLAAVLSLLIPVAAYSFIDLADIGFFNASKTPVDLIIEYKNGRKIDWHLNAEQSIIMRRGFGERIVQVTVTRRGHAPRTDVLARLEGKPAKGTKDNWLCIDGDCTRLLSSGQKQALEKRAIRHNHAVRVRRAARSMPRLPG